MSWSVKIKRSALKSLSRIAVNDRHRLVAAIDGLSSAPQQGTLLKGGLTGLRRIRVGTYRVIYEVRETELIILVVAIGHRREIYR